MCRSRAACHQPSDSESSTTRRPHVDTLRASVSYGRVLNGLEEHQAAEKIYGQLFEALEQILGPSHDIAMKGMEELASTRNTLDYFADNEDVKFQPKEVQALPKEVEYQADVIATPCLDTAQLAAIEPQAHEGRLNYRNFRSCSPFRFQSRSRSKNPYDVLVVRGQGGQASKIGMNSPISVTMRSIAHTVERRSLETRLEVLGARILGTHPPWPLCTSWLKRGSYSEVETLAMQLAEIRKEVLGSKHPDTLPAMKTLTSILLIEGRYVEAERLAIQVFKLRKDSLDNEHLCTISSMLSLGSIWLMQGRYQEVEGMVIEGLELRKRILGFSHSENIPAMACLAEILLRKRRYWEDEALAIQVLEFR